MRTILPTTPDNYLTQKEEVDILSRIVSQSVYTPDDDTSEWREITPEEAAEILKQKEEAQPEPPMPETAEISEPDTE
jgi:hypothetical protein